MFNPKLYNIPYHTVDLSKYSFLVTGGAGFIGSNIVEYLIRFGPKQNPNNPYAAVIPIFCKHFIEGTTPTINGDGITSRDFTFVENAVQANIKALLIREERRESAFQGEEIGIHQTPLSQHELFNVACEDQISLNELQGLLQEINETSIAATDSPERAGDAKHSKASIKKQEQFCGFQPQIRLKIVFEKN